MLISVRMIIGCMLFLILFVIFFFKDFQEKLNYKLVVESMIIYRNSGICGFV